MPSIQFKPSAIKQTKWYEYLLRFLLGGLLTAATGLITKQYGPVIGGLFLTLPSIFPASVTLVQSHKKEQEKKRGVDKKQRIEAGHRDAGLTAEGTALGSFGLLGFAIMIYAFSLRMPPWLVLLLAQVVWIILVVAVWWLYTTITEQRRKR